MLPPTVVDQTLGFLAAVGPRRGVRPSEKSARPNCVAKQPRALPHEASRLQVLAPKTC